MLHHGDADVPRVLVGQQRIQVIKHAGHYAGRHRQRELGRHQPPEPMRERLVTRDNVDDIVDNQLADGQDRHRQQSTENADDDSEGDNCRP